MGSLPDVVLSLHRATALPFPYIPFYQILSPFSVSSVGGMSIDPFSASLLDSDIFTDSEVPIEIILA